MADAIRTAGLTHRFGTATVLDDVGLEVPEGALYGFLGPNGAGKTTTLRVLLGLLRRQQGTVEIFGRTFERHARAILARIGSSIETPSVYGHLTATENLEVWRRLFGCRRQRVRDVLGIVGLADTGRKRVDRFSLGMKQRLAIAVALLHEPELLVLDEPTNGLDPHGILEIRALLVALNRQHGTTILVSSHLLHEVERLVTHIGIIHRGVLRVQGALDVLVAQQAESSRTTVHTDDPQAAAALAGEMGVDARVEGRLVVMRALAPGDAARLAASITSRHLKLFELSTTRASLESLFLDLVGRPE
jgi:ABC-2 type transport system ATP-binding protein